MYLLEESRQSLDILYLTESWPSAVCLLQRKKWRMACGLQSPVKLM